MKRAFILASIIFLLGMSYVHAYTSPGKAQGFVNDFAKVMSSEQVSSLENILSKFSTQTSIQIAVVTIPSLVDETIESYAARLFEEWKIGQKDKDNGVLFLIAMNDRKVRIEVGYGLEGVLTDAQSNGIIQKIVLPEFRNNNYPDGIRKGVEAIVSVLSKDTDYSVLDNNKKSNWNFIYNYGFVLFIVLASILGRSKSWWLGGIFGGIIGVVLGLIYGFFYFGIIAIPVLIVFGLLFDFIVSKGGGGPHGGFWGGYGGGSSGGGFGGFSGGSSGGGGSSGSW